MKKSVFLLLLLCAGIILTGCGVSEEMLASVQADYDARFESLSSTVSADYTAKIGELELTVDALKTELEAARTQLDAMSENESSAREKGWIIVTDYVDANGSRDVSADIQKLIDDNPRRTLYFPDGVYLLNSPICTPADPNKSVDLRLSNYAILRAGSGWKSEEAMVRLGGSHPSSIIDTAGSFYSLTGGIIDGSGKADAVSIESGRETAIRDLSIKNAVIGIHIHKGSNSGSSDADIYNVNIVGTRTNDSIGVLIEGNDNTLTNLRIAGVQYGVRLEAAGNMLRNVHPLYTGGTTYSGSYGFYDTAGTNWYDYCYSDQFRVGFYIKGDQANVYNNCFCYWYSGEGARQTAIRSGGMFNSLVSNIRVGFHKDAQYVYLLEVGKEGGNGVIEYAIVNRAELKNAAHEPHLTGKLIVS